MKTAYNVITKTFEALTKHELYELLRLRAEVFSVEQNCAYNDLDGIDYEALHVFVPEENRIIAYARTFPDRESGHWHIGRVVSAVRKTGLGSAVVEAAEKAAKEKGASCLVMDAQVQAEGFYRKLGFRTVSGVYPIDGIPHVRMEKEV